VIGKPRGALGTWGRPKKRREQKKEGLLQRTPAWETDARGVRGRKEGLNGKGEKQKSCHNIPAGGRKRGVIRNKEERRGGENTPWSPKGKGPIKKNWHEKQGGEQGKRVKKKQR